MEDSYYLFESAGLMQGVALHDMNPYPDYFVENHISLQPCHEIAEMFGIVPLGFFKVGERRE